MNAKYYHALEKQWDKAIARLLPVIPELQEGSKERELLKRIPVVLADTRELDPQWGGEYQGVRRN